jgi:hypothetical protein
MGVSGQHHAPAALYSRERTLGTHSIGGWVGHRACLDAGTGRKNPLPLSGIEPRSPDRPARSQDTILPELSRLLSEIYMPCYDGREFNYINQHLFI